MNAAIKDVVATGAILGLSPGDSEERVRDVLGVVEDYNSDNYGTVLKYGKLQVFVTNGVIDLIIVYFLHKEQRRRHRIVWEDWNPTETATFRETKAQFRRMDLLFSVSDDYGQRTLIFAMGVKMFFTKRKRAWRLYSLSLQNRHAGV
jgi:hypothetical protein